MKRTFLKVALFSLLAAAMPVSFVSCKDYDDDITNINETNDGLSKQITQLESQLEACRTAASNAANNAADALKKGDAAMAQAEAAKQAAESAKADAIQAVIEQLRPLINQNATDIQANADAIAKLLSRVEAIENGGASVGLDAIGKRVDVNEKAIAAIELQMKALANFKSALNGSNFEGVDGIIANIDALNAAYTQLKADAATQSDINAINTRIDELAQQVITQVNGNVSTYISGRLTSVTLMPDLYIGGIPTIEFESAKYTKKVFTNGEWVNASPAKAVIVSNNSAKAEYRLNPNMVTEQDIDMNGLAFVSRIAESRAAGENDIVKVAKASVENGVLKVNLGKTNTESLNLTGNKIYTVSLKVPVAQKHLFTEQGETSANVYSEYTRLAETYFTPELRYVAGEYLGTLDHPVDSATAYGYAMNTGIVKKLVYNQTYDLYQLVEGCKLFSNPTSHKAMTIAEVREYGFDIKFHVATAAYNVGSVDKTDQQKFARVKDGVLTPVLPTGAGDNHAIVGKQPVIAASLVDVTNNNVIEVKYFKVQFTEKEMKPIELPIPAHESDLECGNQVWAIDWNTMVENVLSKVPENGISKEDFIKIYGGAGNAVVNPITAGTLDITMTLDGTGASVPVMEWTITPAQLGKLTVGGSKTFTATVTFTDPQGLRPNIVVNLTWKVIVNDPETALGTTDPLKWKDNTMLVYPVPMPIPYEADEDGNYTTAYYNTNILEGRKKPYVTGMLGCGFWDVDFDGTYGGTSLAFQKDFGHWMMNLENQSTLNTVNFSIENNAAGIALVESAATVSLKWQSNLNGQSDNAYTFGKTDLKIVKILTLNQLAAGSFTDDSQVSQKINLNKAYSLTDAYGHLVAELSTADEPYADSYYKYYAVKAPVFDGANMYVADNAAGTSGVRTLEALNMTANIDATTSDITFQNNGAPLQADAYLIVPVTVQHKWGKLSGKIAIQLKKKL